MSLYGKGQQYGLWRRRNAPYLIAACLALVTVLLGGPEINEGKAMDPTIKDGQVLVVSKHDYSQKRGLPDRDQLVILEKPRSRDVSDDNVITRVIGLPGETIKIQGGKLYVDGKEYVTGEGISGAAGRNMKVKLSRDEVFVLCDNREETKYDSRNSKLGPINMKDDIKGNVLLRVWPPREFGTLK